MTVQGKYSVLIVEPSEIIAEGLLSILKESHRFDCLHPLTDGAFLADSIAGSRPDLLLVNPTLFPVSGKNSLRAILQTSPSTIPVAIVYQYVEHALLDSSRMVLDIRCPREEMLTSLMDILQEKPQPKTLADIDYELSEREKDVLALVAKGLINKEIADRLNISVHTVITHRKNIVRKTGIKTVAGLTVYALMRGIIQ